MWEDVAREIGLAARDIIQNCRLAKVNSSIYPVAQLGARRWLLLKAQDTIVPGQFDYPAFSDIIAMMQQHPNANATSIFTSSGKAAREFAKHATASMVGVNIGVAAPMAYFPFGGAKDSFFGDLKAHGRDAFEFYTDKKVTISRWF